MSQKSIAQTAPAVQFETVAINRQRQLGQLSRLAPDLYRQIIEAIRSFPGLKHDRRIAAAMQQVLTRSILVNAARPGGSQTEVLEVPGQDRPFDGAQDRPLYDLVIASRKYGYGSTTNATAPILWWKMAGQEKQTPSWRASLVDPAIQKRLEGYELVDTEVQPNRIIRKYRKVACDG